MLRYRSLYFKKRKRMKRIIMGLMLLPFTAYAMNVTVKGTPFILSLTRDGEGDRHLGVLLPEKEARRTFRMASRDRKNSYDYIVALSLLAFKDGKATIVGSVWKQQMFRVEEYAEYVTETIKINEETIPVNERKVIDATFVSDMEYPVTLGLVILEPKPKL